MEADDINVMIMANEDTLLADLVTHPQAGGPVRSTGDKVVTKRSPA